METIEDVILYALDLYGEVYLSLYEASHPTIKRMITQKKIVYYHAQNTSSKLLVTIRLRGE